MPATALQNNCAAAIEGITLSIKQVFERTPAIVCRAKAVRQLAFKRSKPAERISTSSAIVIGKAGRSILSGTKRLALGFLIAFATLACRPDGSIQAPLAVNGGAAPATGSGSAPVYLLSALLANPSGHPGFDRIAVADLNGDGDRDIVCTSALGDSVRVYLQSPKRQFGPGAKSVFEPPTLQVTNPTDIAVADLDSNSLDDVVTASRGGNLLVIGLQTSPGQFERIEVEVFRPEQLTILDLDRDGRLDLTVRSLQEVIPLFQDSSGHFAPNKQLAGSIDGALFFGVDLTSFAAADLSGNGLPDLLASSPQATARDSGPRAMLLPQLSPDTFADLPNLSIEAGSAFSSMDNLAIADINQDGLLDFVSAGFESSNLALFRQRNDGSFGAPEELLVSPFSNPVDLVLDDIDHDGDTDIGTANDKGLLFYFQDEQHEFQRAFNSAGVFPLRPRCLATSDLDNDGLPEFACANIDNVAFFFASRP